MVIDTSAVVAILFGEVEAERFAEAVWQWRCRCPHLRDEGAPAGIVAVIVYPMNALGTSSGSSCC